MFMFHIIRATVQLHSDSRSFVPTFQITTDIMSELVIPIWLRGYHICTVRHGLTSKKIKPFFARSNQTTMLSRRIICERSTRRWRTHIGGSSAEGFGKVDDCGYKRRVRNVHMRGIVDHIPVQAPAPGLRGLQIAVMLKLRLTNDSKKKRISILSVILL